MTKPGLETLQALCAATLRTIFYDLRLEARARGGDAAAIDLKQAAGVELHRRGAKP